jgi:hypothetical protein
MAQETGGGFGSLLPPGGEPPKINTGLGSLGQQARLKNLRTARIIFIIVGLLTIAVNVFGLGMARELVNAEIDKEVAAIRRQGNEVDPVELEKVRAALVRTVQVMSLALIAVGIVYLVFAGIVQKYPVPITISGLVIYVAAAAIFAVLDPSTIAQGIIVKVLIVIGLVKAVQSAIAYQREHDESLAPAA